MEFEPFHSDNEDDNLTFMPEKKKKDEKKKRNKTRQDKKEKSISNDNFSPAGSKVKSVHGVVGPAEYIQDQTSPVPEETVQPDVAVLPTTPNVQNQLFVQKTPQKSQNTQQLQQPLPQLQQQQPTPQVQWNTNPPIQPSHQHQANFSHQSSSSSNFQQFQNQTSTQFPTSFSQSTKIERPHSSAALLQERSTPQSPIAFKQQSANNTPQKMTLLAQAMNSGQSQQQQQFGLAQPTAAQSTHHRSPSYGRAMSVPLLTNKAENQELSFQTHFESALEIDTKGLPAGPPIPESPSSQKGSMSSPPLTPSGLSTQELWNNAPVHDHQEQPSPVFQRDIDWANFAPQTAGGVSAAEPIEIPRKRRNTEGGSSIASSVPESTSSVDSVDGDDAVWVINPEQREYYTTQFAKLQPNTSDAIKGPQARDFFLKSTLPTETLSKIWHLSDLDKDGALNLEEFCVAMHLVVAVRHGVELPAILPATLLNGDEDLPNGQNDNTLDEDASQLITDNENEHTKEWSAEFDSTDGDLVVGNLKIKTLAQPSPASVTATTESRDHPVSYEDSTIKSHDQVPTQPPLEEAEKQTTLTPSSPTQATAHRDSSGNISAIARPRATATKNVNLMDASPWQLLPPPSGKTSKQSAAKKSLKMDSDDIGSDPNLSSLTSSEGRIDSLVNIDTAVDKSPPVKHNFNIDYDHLKVKSKKDKDGYYRNLSKEKSRSIDSLRSDISESSMFEWKRQSIRRDSRLRSNDNLSSEKMKEFENPPVPPRNRGHARASSLDFNQMFGSKSPRLDSDERLNVVEDDSPQHRDSKFLPPQKPPRSNPPSTEDLDPPNKLSISLELIASKSSMDSLTEHDAHKKHHRVHSLGSPLADGKRANSKEHVVRFNDEPEVLANSVKSPMEIQMRKHELQARLRDLKSKNTTLLSLISQLDMEWKEVSEERIALEVRLQRVEQDID